MTRITPPNRSRASSSRRGRTIPAAIWLLDFIPDPSWSALTYATPSAVLPPSLVTTVAARLPASLVALRSLQDVACCVRDVTCEYSFQDSVLSALPHLKTLHITTPRTIAVLPQLRNVVHLTVRLQFFFSGDLPQHATRATKNAFGTIDAFGRPDNTLSSTPQETDDLIVSRDKFSAGKLAVVCEAMPQLLSLRLDGGDFAVFPRLTATDYAAIGTLPALRFLDLLQVEHTDGFEDLGIMPSLTTLKAHCVSAQGLAAIGRMSKLSTLRLDFCRAARNDGILQISSLRSLTSLRIDGWAQPSSLNRRRRELLDSEYVSSTFEDDNTTDEVCGTLRHLAAIPSLKVLYLDQWTCGSRVGFSGLTNVETLTITDDCAPGPCDRVLADIARMPSLVHLTLPMIQSPIVLSELKAAPTSLRSFSFDAYEARTFENDRTIGRWVAALQAYLPPLIQSLELRSVTGVRRSDVHPLWRALPSLKEVKAEAGSCAVFKRPDDAEVMMYCVPDDAAVEGAPPVLTDHVQPTSPSHVSVEEEITHGAAATAAYSPELQAQWCHPPQTQWCYPEAQWQHEPWQQAQCQPWQHEQWQQAQCQPWQQEQWQQAQYATYQQWQQYYPQQCGWTPAVFGPDDHREHPVTTAAMYPGHPVPLGMPIVMPAEVPPMSVELFEYLSSLDSARIIPLGMAFPTPA